MFVKNNSIPVKETVKVVMLLCCYAVKVMLEQHPNIFKHIQTCKQPLRPKKNTILELLLFFYLQYIYNIYNIYNLHTIYYITYNL